MVKCPMCDGAGRHESSPLPGERCIVCGGSRKVLTDHGHPAMYCIAIRQPWPEMILAGAKTLEVRSWTTNIRGRVLIAAPMTGCREQMRLAGVPKAPQGVLRLTADLVDCRLARKRDAADAMVYWSLLDGSYVWQLADPVAIEPVPHKSRLGWYKVHV